MRKYKTYVVSILISIIILGPIGQFFLFRLTPAYDLSLKTCLYNTASWVQNRPKIVVMGSSHALHHIIPSNIVSLNKSYKKGDVVNIGAEAASAFEMLTSYQKNREKFRNIQVAYFTLEPHMLSEKYYLYNTFEKIFLNYEQWKYLESENHISNSYFYPIHLFFESLKFECPKKNRYYGYKPLKHTAFNTFKSGQVPKKIYKPLNLYPISFFELSAIKKLKNLVEEDGGKFIFVLTPTYSWYRFYEKEASRYDKALVALLNELIGDSAVIGSFDKDDFGLTYDDFKDDTHLSHTGAAIFTDTLFSNVQMHLKLPAKPFHHLFSYHIDTNDSQIVIPASKLNWKVLNNASKRQLKNSVAFDIDKVDKKVKLQAIFEKKHTFRTLFLDVKLPSEKVSLISCTLYRNTKASKKNVEYAHYFIKGNFAPGSVRRFRLSASNVSKHSQNFNFSDIDGIAIRLYTKKSISDFQVRKLTFTQ